MVPDKPGNHLAVVTKHEQLFADHIIRPAIIQTATFSVGTDDMLFSATSSVGNLSLAEQVRLGTHQNT